MVPDSVIFDAESPIEYVDDEPESDVVEEYPNAVAVADTAGYANYVTLAEIRYTLAPTHDQTTANEYLD